MLSSHENKRFSERTGLYVNNYECTFTENLTTQFLIPLQNMTFQEFCETQSSHESEKVLHKKGFKWILETYLVWLVKWQKLETVAVLSTFWKTKRASGRNKHLLEEERSNFKLWQHIFWFTWLSLFFISNANVFSYFFGIFYMLFSQRFKLQNLVTTVHDKWRHGKLMLFLKVTLSFYFWFVLFLSWVYFWWRVTEVSL